MKRIALALVLAAALPLAPASTALAGNQEWAVAGKILTGLLTLRVLHNAAHRGQQPAPAPVMIRPGLPPSPPCPPARTWVDGHYTYQYTNVWVPGSWQKEWVPPQYETRTLRRGRRYIEERVLVADGYWKKTWQRGYPRRERQQVWVPGHWE